MRLVRIRRRVVDLVVDLHKTPIGHSDTWGREAVERSRLLGRHPEERVVAVRLCQFVERSQCLVPAPALDPFAQPIGGRHLKLELRDHAEQSDCDLRRAQ